MGSSVKGAVRWSVVDWWSVEKKFWVLKPQSHLWVADSAQTLLVTSLPTNHVSGAHPKQERVFSYWPK